MYKIYIQECKRLPVAITTTIRFYTIYYFIIASCHHGPRYYPYLRSRQLHRRYSLLRPSQPCPPSKISSMFMVGYVTIGGCQFTDIGFVVLSFKPKRIMLSCTYIGMERSRLNRYRGSSQRHMEEWFTRHSGHLRSRHR